MGSTSHAAILAQIADELRQVKELIAANKRMLADRADPDEVRQGLHDITSSYALTGQLTEVYEAQKAAMIELTASLTTYMERAEDERADILETLKQIRELMRRHYQGLQDLERAVYGGETRAEHARRMGEAGGE